MTLFITAKSLRDRRKSYLWWLAGTMAYVGLMAAVYPVIRDRSAEYQAMLENYPEALLTIFGLTSVMSIASGVGFLTSYFFGWLVPALFLTHAIGYASRATAGEEEDRTMDLLLSTPISRRRLISEKLLGLVVLQLGLAAVLWAALAIVGEMVGFDVPLANAASACLGGALLGIASGAITLAIGALTGRRGMTGGLGAGIAVFSYLFYTVGTLDDRFTALGKVSLLTLYFEQAPLLNGFDMRYALGFAAIIAIGWAMSAWLFERHDISS